MTALLQITEPRQTDQLTAGIDLGTTNSLIASFFGKNVETIPDENGSHILPSIVYYRNNQDIIVGDQALQMAVSDPLNTITSIKRLIGRELKDLDTFKNFLPWEFEESNSRVPHIFVHDNKVTPEEVSSEILKVLKVRAERFLGGKLDGVVITVPAYFDDVQRQATKNAAKLAGLNVLRLLNEPTAAAIAYGLDRNIDGIHVVYDLGGGTFDISVLRLSKGIFEVISTGGNSSLGGDDFDYVITEWLIQEANITDNIDKLVQQKLLQTARWIKEQLTDNDSVYIKLPYVKNCNFEKLVNRESINQLIRPLIKKTVLVCHHVLKDAEISLDDIVDIIMVGGSSRVPLVREMVEEFYGQAPLINVDPDKVVAIGAAIQANKLGNNKYLNEEALLLLDVNPLSLGLETMGGLTEKIIHRNTTIPVICTKEFTTFKDGQSAIEIHIVQGERELVSDCRSLARFTLNNIPPMAAGAIRILVTFQIDADGLLSVEAEEKTSGTKSSIMVRPSYGLSDDKIADLLSVALKCAEKDKKQRQVREQKIKARRIIDALYKALVHDGDLLLNSKEQENLHISLKQLTKVIEGDDNDPEKIQEEIQSLEKSCRFYVERRVNRGIHDVMADHILSDFKS